MVIYYRKKNWENEDKKVIVTFSVIQGWPLAIVSETVTPLSHVHLMSFHCSSTVLTSSFRFSLLSFLL